MHDRERRTDKVYSFCFPRAARRVSRLAPDPVF
jgi:hypothetical protein